MSSVYADNLPTLINARPALEIATYFVKHSGFTKTNMQVQKMTYIAHGYMMAVHNEALILDDVKVWDYGPVILSIYNEFKKYGSAVIGKASYDINSITNKQKDILNDVYSGFGKLCGYYLSDITHDDGSGSDTPWMTCMKKYGKNSTIPNDITRDYYKARLAIQ